MYYNIKPLAKPRMTRSDKWKKRPAVVAYRNYKDDMRIAGVTIPERLYVVFHLPMPKSWSAKKRDAMRDQPHKQRPDVDNLLKGLMDFLPEDSHIHETHARKVWADEGGMLITSLDYIENKDTLSQHFMEYGK